MKFAANVSVTPVLATPVPPLAPGRIPVTPVEPELARFAATCAAGIALVSATVPVAVGNVKVLPPDSVAVRGSFMDADEKFCKPVEYVFA
jgi:hypothetical protein